MFVLTEIEQESLKTWEESGRDVELAAGAASVLANALLRLLEENNHESSRSD